MSVPSNFESDFSNFYNTFHGVAKSKGMRNPIFLGFLTSFYNTANSDLVSLPQTSPLRNIMLVFNDLVAMLNAAIASPNGDISSATASVQDITSKLNSLILSCPSSTPAGNALQSALASLGKITGCSSSTNTAGALTCTQRIGNIGDYMGVAMCAVANISSCPANPPK